MVTFIYELFIISTSFITYFICNNCIINSLYLFVTAGLKGRDYGRPTAPPIPEAVGVVASAVYLCCISLNLVAPFTLNHFISSLILDQYLNLAALLAGGWSICCMCLLGFTDDVLNLRWRTKLLLPAFSSIPLLLVYIIQGGSTHVLLPFPFKYLFGSSVNLGLLFYIYMLLLTVFCTNSINILAGINGLEVGQSVIIAVFMLFLAIIEIYLGNYKAYIIIFFLTPHLSVSLSLLKYNWYPAVLFVGDTYCYFTGMTFAVCGILGNCSKTLLLLFIPQILNFIYSSPQLFKYFPCPRHRLPSYNETTDMREPSTFGVRISDLDMLSCIMLGFMARIGSAKITRKGLGHTDTAEVDNMTLLNMYLRYNGPTHERDLSRKLIEFQVFCGALALFLRYTIAIILF